MSKRIIIDPVTRIEGHAKISIFVDDAGNVTDAEFHVVEFRGFEKFCEGRPFGEMPGFTQREVALIGQAVRYQLLVVGNDCAAGNPATFANTTIGGR